MLISGPSGFGISLMTPSETENEVVDLWRIWTRLLKSIGQLKENRSRRADPDIYSGYQSNPP